ncbi:MAG: hypothetical protein L6265_09810 [Thermoplasmatales archaeon]|nr:hypothetical protein [Thermoplasmatales archaeon]
MAEEERIRGTKMVTIEEIKTGIQEKGIERAEAVKRILEDIKKKRKEINLKRKEIEEGRKKYRAEFYPKPTK